MTNFIKIYLALVCFYFSTYSEQVHSRCYKSNYTDELKGIISTNIENYHFECDNDAVVIRPEGILFTLKENESYINNGERAELNVDFPFDIDDTVEYEFEFELVPSKTYDNGWKGRWVIIAQWHDLPDVEHGESWKSYKKNPPTISYYLKYDNGLYLGLKTLHNNITFPVKSRSYVVCKNRIHWLPVDDGTIDGYCIIDGFKYSFGFSDKIMNNNLYHYFKFGLYRDKYINKIMSVKLIKLTIRMLDHD
jgi:hypothetical protein